MPGGPLDPFSAIHLPGPSVHEQPSPLSHLDPSLLSPCRLLLVSKLKTSLSRPLVASKAVYGSKLTSKSFGLKAMSPL